MNNRSTPVAVNAGSPLQSILASIFPDQTPGVADQSPYGMWRVASGSPTLISPGLASTSPGSSFGLWSGTDTTSLKTVSLFLDGAVGGQTAATLLWSGTSKVTIIGLAYDAVNDAWASDCTYVNCGVYSGIDRGTLGFYMQVGGNRYYSVDQLNGGGTPGALAYQQGSTSNWAIAFDSGSRNFADGVLKIESLLPVPEPGTLMLFGTGLFGLSAAARRRLRKS